MENESKFKNWKSFLAFFLFMGIYAYTAFSDKSEGVIWNTGLLALIALLAIMSRTDLGAQLMSTVVELIKAKAKK